MKKLLFQLAFISLSIIIATSIFFSRKNKQMVLNDIEKLEKLFEKKVNKKENLVTLDLSNHKLSTLPQEIVEWDMFESLNLSGNQLTSLPSEIKECKNLKELNLNGNNFSQTEKDKIKEWLPNTEIIW